MGVSRVASGVTRLLGRAKASRQTALLWVLAVATERQMRLPDVLDAFADDSRGVWRIRVRNLAAALNAGVPLHEALERSPGLVPREAVLAARVGAESGTLPASLRQAAASLSTRYEMHGSSPGSMFLYLITLGMVLSLVASFLMYWIVPKFKKIFEDFGTDLPEMTKVVITTSDFIMQYFYLFLPVAVLALWAAVTVAIFGIFTDRGPFRWTARFMPRLRTPEILRSLRVAVDAGRPLSGVLSTLAQQHWQPAMRRRLLQVKAEVEQGADCWDSLRRAGLLRRREAAVLEAARRAGNLPWALEHTARNVERRTEYRTSLVLEFARPLILLGFALVVGFFAIGMFLPLLKLINDLS